MTARDRQQLDRRAQRLRHASHVHALARRRLRHTTRAIHFAVGQVDRTVTVEGDRQILAAAVSNLLQNAFKFTPKGGNVSLGVHVTVDRVLIDVEDECGGLPPGKADLLFHPFEQHGEDRSGVGLGLSICMKAATASGGELRVRDFPGKGCVFTLALPRKQPPPLTVIDGGKRSAGSPGIVGGGGARGARAEPARAITALRRS